ncbi:MULTISPECIES: hypothetical protein [Actinomycetes]|uniref:hypothetical protein n=1 Tax=Actinomycetes TaxID=1760 RepID=UPI0004BEF9BE|nr:MULTISPECIES: hypothetical protein [Actinomycetes]MCK0515874.1 hypothetical protein [Williamsia sp. DF01-3]PVY24767.1 hypothetical protein C7458_1203 [Williamsia marianensis]
MAHTTRLPHWFSVLVVASGATIAFTLGLVLSAPYATDVVHTRQPHPPNITDPGWPHLHNWAWAATVGAVILTILLLGIRRIGRD